MKFRRPRASSILRPWRSGQPCPPGLSCPIARSRPPRSGLQVPQSLRPLRSGLQAPQSLRARRHLRLAPIARQHPTLGRSLFRWSGHLRTPPPCVVARSRANAACWGSGTSAARRLLGARRLIQGRRAVRPCPPRIRAEESGLRRTRRVRQPRRHLRRRPPRRAALDWGSRSAAACPAARRRPTSRPAVTTPPMEARRGNPMVAQPPFTPRAPWARCGSWVDQRRRLERTPRWRRSRPLRE